MSAPAWQPPRRIDAIDFWLRSRLLAAAHAVREACRPSARRWPGGVQGVQGALADAPVLAQYSTPLWSDGRPEEFPLVAGKVHNLRVARRAFDAVEVPAGELLSFWRQLGRPSGWRGFVQGREVRGGCVVPTLAGGICQLSNALATVAARAGFELVERHGHTARVEQATGGEIDAVDATVFWNYVDLKVRARHAWRLEVELTADALVLRIRARSPMAVPVVLRRAEDTAAGAVPTLPVARGCLSCDQTACFRHRPPAGVAAQQGRTAALLDTWTPEFARYLEAHHAGAERMQPVPVRLAFWRPLPASGWPAEAVAPVRSPRWTSLRRAVWQRLWARHAGRRQASLIDGQRWLALAYAAWLKPDHTHLVVDQALLPHLQRTGALDGRRVTVLAGALPMAEIERRLDAAAQRWPGDATLRDFRADPALVRAEAAALAQAFAVVTPHAQVARHLAQVAPQALLLRLDWTMPAVPAVPAAAAVREAPPIVVFAASALARKGARELASALQGVPCRLRVLGSPSDDAQLWQGVDRMDRVEHLHWRGDGLRGAGVVVLPAHIEHAPRALLRALAAGVPVVASTACGLASLPGVHEVAAGNVEGLRAALQSALAGRPPVAVVDAPSTFEETSSPCP